MDAATDIQALGIEGFHDPSASEVVLWARKAGYGGPAPTREEAQEEARAILERLRDEPTE